MQGDVTSEEAVAQAFRAAVERFGGVDIVISNAGVASSATIEETTLASWNRSHAILGTGYFLVAREAFRLLRRQAIGGSVIFVASKNGLVAGRNAAAYSSAKAAELHLARCLAEEGGAAGIRVNTVNPDAVLQGSGIWDSSWREERAAAYGIASGRARGALPQAHDARREHPARGRRRGGRALRLRARAPARAPATSSTSTAGCRRRTPASREVHSTNGVRPHPCTCPLARATLQGASRGRRGHCRSSPSS